MAANENVEPLPDFEQDNQQNIEPLPNVEQDNQQNNEPLPNVEQDNQQNNAEMKAHTIRLCDLKITFQPCSRWLIRIFERTADFFRSDPDRNKGRVKWRNNLEFILTCIGYTVGLGNLWGFPYLCYKNGGGAFLIPYLIMMVIIGLPMTFMEFALGQFSSSGIINLWECSPLFKGLGISMALVTFFICIYYNVIIGWCFYYLFASFQSTLPWIACDNYWNDHRCRSNEVNATNQANTSKNTRHNDFPEACNVTGGLILNCTKYQTPGEQHWERQVLGMVDPTTGDDNLQSVSLGLAQWHITLCTILAWILVFLILYRGIISSGKIVYITVFLPYILLVVLIINGALLPGGRNGIIYYVTPDFKLLGKMEVWVTAASQIFYSIGICLGGLHTMASFNNFKINIFRDSLIIVTIDTVTSILCGFAVFSTLGYLSYKTSIPIESVAQQSVGLTFIAFPEGIATMHVPQFFSIVFFTMMITIGIDSQFAMMLTLIDAIQDMFPRIKKSERRIKILKFIVCFFMFIISLPMCCKGGIKIFVMVRDYCSGINLFIIGFVEIIAVFYVYGYKKFEEDLLLMLNENYRGRYFWLACWLALTPVAILTLIVMSCVQYGPSSYGNITFPDYIQVFGWLVVICTLLPIPIMMIWKFIDFEKCIKFKEEIEDTDRWAPELFQYRDQSERYKHRMIKPDEDTDDEGHENENYEERDI